MTSNDGTQQGRSGYDVLVEYFPAATTRVVRRKRRHPRNLYEKIKRRLLARGAASSWYMLSSRELEKEALRQIRERSPQLVHHLWGNRDWGFIHKHLAAMRIPFVVTVHSCPDGMGAVFVRPEELQAVSAFVLMSEHQKPFFEARGVPSSRLHVVHHGIDVTSFRPLETPPGQEDVFTVLSVGQTRRNFPALCQLIESMETEPDVRFRIISSPSVEERFAQYGNVRFESGLSNDELRNAYQTASVQILTADDATANNALLEGIACGLPIVGEGVGGIPEYCGENAAILTAPNDISALRAGILRLRDDDDERLRRAAAARERALELRWENSVDQLGHLYNQLMAEGPTQALGIGLQRG